MKLKELYNSVTLGINPKPVFREVIEYLNTIIRLINSRENGYRSILNVTLLAKEAAEGNTFSDFDVGMSTMSGAVADYGIFMDYFEYDSDDYKLSIKTNSLITKITAIYVDDVLWRNVPYQDVKDGNNADRYIYCSRGRDIYFPIDIESGTTSIKMDIMKRYDLISSPDDKDGEYNDMPDTYYQELVSGAIYLITSKEAIAQVNREIFNNEKYRTKSLEIPNSYIKLKNFW